MARYVYREFDPNKDKFFQPASFFGLQSMTQFGNATRTNPKVRNFATLNENISLAKSFPIRESIRAEFRAEAFNLLNRTVFGPSSGALSLQSPNFGLWDTGEYSPYDTAGAEGVLLTEPQEVSDVRDDRFFATLLGLPADRTALSCLADAVFRVTCPD